MPEPHGGVGQDGTWQSWGRAQPGTATVRAAGLSWARRRSEVMLSPSATASQGHTVGFLHPAPDAACQLSFPDKHHQHLKQTRSSSKEPLRRQGTAARSNASRHSPHPEHPWEVSSQHWGKLSSSGESSEWDDSQIALRT